MSELMAGNRGLVVACPACGQLNRVPYDRMADTPVCGVCHAEAPIAPGPITVTSDMAFDALIEGASTPVLVDFWAPWCGPCRAVAPEIEKVAASAGGRFLVAKVNTESLQQTAAALQISSIPALAVFRGGSEIARTVGARPAPAIEEFVREAAALP